MGRDVRRSRIFIGIAAWLLLLPLAARAADTPAPASTSGFEEVTVDLNGQIFNRVLPFDVPFIIAGPVPQSTSSLEVSCRMFKTDRRKGKVESACWEGGKPLTWRNTIDPAATNPQFRVLVPPLEAEAIYKFSFTSVKKVTADEAKAFADKVRQIVDASLWGDPRSGASLPLVSDQLTDAEIAAIRAQLVDALKQVTGADRFPETGNIFNEATPFAAIRNELNQLLLPVRNAQSQIDSTAENYRGDVEDLNPRLQKLRADSTLQRLQDGLAKSTDPSAQDRAAEIAAALAVADAPALRPADRQSAAVLTAFVQASGAYFSDASARMGKLRAFLTDRLVEPDGSPKPMLAPLVESGKLSRDDLKSLAGAAQDLGPVGRIDRALKRVGQSVLGNLQDSLDTRAQAVEVVAEAYRTRVENMIIVAGSTTGDFQTQSNNYISADAGVACAPELSTCSSYAGTNIYFRPVNKAAPLSQFGSFFSKESFSRRASLTVGLTANGIGDSKTREDLFGSQTLVYGFGVRMTNSVRFTVGGLLFRKLSPNPLSTDKKLSTTYFASISFDIDIVPTLGGIGKLLR